MTQSTFIWHDLATTDPEAAAAFYAAVVGWAQEPVPEMDYTLFKAGERRAAGLMALPPHLRERGVPPHWTGYIEVADVDATVAELVAAGGSIRHDPDDIPGVGRFAVVADPGGAQFNLFTPGGSGPAPAPMAEGFVGWSELIADDHAREFAFYQRLFGWQKSRAIDMGPMGTYQIFNPGGAGALDMGGMMNRPEPGVHPHWNFYFAVPGIDAARGRIEAHGGKVSHGPVEVPGGSWIVGGIDPQGAHFSLVSARK